MIVDRKELYEAPSITLVEVKAEGIVCASQRDYIYVGLDED